MSTRCVTPVKQVVKDDKPCPDAPARKPNTFNSGNVTIKIPVFDEGKIEYPRAETVMCKTPERRIRPRNETGSCPGAPVKRDRKLEFTE